MTNNVLIVCTANRCRSPMAEAFLNAELQRRDSGWRATSAGLMSGGSPVVDDALNVMNDLYGIDLSAHRSRQLQPYLIDEVDLILGMERRHVREVATQEPAAFERSFTVREFVRRARAAPPAANLPSETYFRLLGAGRTTKTMLGHATEDEIEDPIGLGRPVFEKAAGEIAGAMAFVADVLVDLG